MLYVFDKRFIAVFGQIQERILHKYFEHHQELFYFTGFELVDFFADAELAAGYAPEVRFNRIENLVGPINLDVQNVPNKCWEKHTPIVTKLSQTKGLGREGTREAERVSKSFQCLESKTLRHYVTGKS